MQAYLEIKVRGKKVLVPTLSIANSNLIVEGKYLKIVSVHDETWFDSDVDNEPGFFVSALKKNNLGADIFTFAQKLPNIKPKFDYYWEWDNIAAVPITNYKDWLDGLSTDMRKDLKRAKSREVVAMPVPFDDDLVRGIISIHNDSLTRQGRFFYHYGKDFETVKADYSTYLNRSEFVGAFFNDELIGLIKLVYVGDIACMMQILSKASHYDKRPTNALIAKSVEICVQRNMKYLTYGKMYYGKKRKSSLVAFKHRNGFAPIFLPRYYIPLSKKGKLAIAFRLHRGILGLLPGGLINLLIRLRSFFERRFLVRLKSPGDSIYLTKGSDKENSKE